MRVLFVSPYFRPYLGGIERAIEELARELLTSPEIESVGVLTTKYAFPRIPMTHLPNYEVTSDGISIFRINSVPRAAPPFYSVPLVWFSPGQLNRHLKFFDPHIIHWVGDGWFWGHILTRLATKAKIIFTPSFHSLSLSRQWLRPINGILCRLVDKVVTLSSIESKLIQKAYWVRDDKMATVGWGIRLPNNFKPRISKSMVRILCVGRLGNHKGQRWLIEVYRRAKCRFKYLTNLILIGRDEGEEAIIKQDIKRLGLVDEILITGEVTDAELDDWYENSDLLALFSKYEAFGLVYFEAMARGIPVLTHRVGSNDELLSKGALVVGPYDMEAAIEQMVTLVNDSSRRELLGRSGREHVLNNYTWSKVGQKYIEMYKNTQ